MSSEMMDQTEERIRQVRYGVRWQSKLTGYASHGEPFTADKSVAEREVARLNAEWPNVQHDVLGPVFVEVADAT